MKNAGLLSGAWVLAICLLCGAAARAQVTPLGPEFAVNTYTTDAQISPAVAARANGDFVVVWESRQDADLFGIFAQRYSSSGAAVGTEFAVNSYTTGAQSTPAVALAPNGDFVVTWQSDGQDGSYLGVYAQRFASSGGLLGTEFRVNTTVAYSQSESAVAASSSGFVVVWQAEMQDGDGEGIFARRFDSGGAALGGEIQVNSHTTSAQFLPAIAMSADGTFVVTWTSYGQDGNYGGIFARRFDAAGMPLSPEFQVNTTTTGGQLLPAVALDGSGRLVVAWQGADDGYGDGVFAQRFASNGTALGSQFQVNVYTTYGQGAPSVSLEPDGDMIVAWRSDNDGDPGGIFARRYLSSGAADGGEFQVNVFTTNDQSAPAVGVDDSGRFVVVWQSFDQDGDGLGVFGRRFAGPTNASTPTATDTPLIPPPSATPTTTPSASASRTPTATIVAGSPTSTRTPTRTPTASPTRTPTASPIATSTRTPVSHATCETAPRADCASAGVNRLTYRTAVAPDRRRLIWKWIGGPTVQSEFGYPPLSTELAVCIYEESALVAVSMIEPGYLWTPLLAGFRYKNTLTNASGIAKAILKERSATGKIIVRGKGTNVAVPAAPISPASTLRVQMVKDPLSGPKCWESVFPPGTFKQ